MKNTINSTKTENLPNTPLRFFFYVSRPYAVAAIVATIFVTVAAVGSVGLRMLVEWIVDAVEKSDMATVAMWVLLYPVLYFLISIFWRGSGVVARSWLLGAPKRSTDLLSAYVMKQSHNYFSDRFAGSISNKISNVANTNEEFVAMFLWSYLENTIPLVLTAIVFFQTDFWAGLLFTLMIVVTLITNMLLMPRKRVFSRAVADAQSKTTGVVVDILSNIQAIRQYTGYRKEYEHITKQTTDVKDKGSISFLYSEYTMFINTLLFTLFCVAIFVVVVNGWLAGDISAGRLISLILLINHVSGMVVFLGRLISQTAKLYGRAEDGLDEILIPHEIKDKPEAAELAATTGAITFYDIDFRYEDNLIFNHFNLVIPAGERVGLVGQSGAGKTTLVSLLLRQHDVDGGEIKIDGRNIAAVTQDSLRAAIAVVPQEPLLFHRTIRENIAYGKPGATDEEIIAVAKKAQAHEFISALSEGYDTLVGERGVKLSGGQKQRVAIARAMLKDAPILVLDEATSALDSESEVEIQKALHQLMVGKTVIAVAHRLSTLREMDRIVVLEKGKIVEDGSHEVLSRAGGVYERLWNHQAGGFVE